MRYILAAAYGVEKIKTIGDAYMVAAGIPEPQPDHAIRIAELATRMLETVNDVRMAMRLEQKWAVAFSARTSRGRFYFDARHRVTWPRRASCRVRTKGGTEDATQS
jgi:hypothetical protein